MKDRSLAEKYLPVFYRDEKEPFCIHSIGITIYEESGNSVSSACFLKVEGNTAFVVEYAVCFDFDIQHLYDLEHVFVYVGHEGQVLNVESSFHGCFYKSMINGDLKFRDGTHPVLYLQPGKHGIMPDPKYFYLYRELYDACGLLAGNGGFLVAPMFDTVLHTDPVTDEMVRQYIQKQYRFVPSMQFLPADFNIQNLISYQELEKLIPQRMEEWLKKIRNAGGNLCG